MGIIIFLSTYIPIQYNIELLRYISFFISVICSYELYSQVIIKSKNNNFFTYLFYFYWLFFPVIIINFLYNLLDIFNIIMITTFSDIAQQLSNRIFVKIYTKKDTLYNLMLYNPFRYLSPKKTIIGYLGGFTTLTLYFYFDYNVNLLFFLYIFGCIGDLLASYFKRKYNIKDYSNYLGAHGGFLDRFDSILFNINYFYIHTLVFNISKY